MAKKSMDDDVFKSIFNKNIDRSDKGILAYLWRELIKNGHYSRVMNTLIKRYVEREKSRLAALGEDTPGNRKNNKTVTTSAISNLVTSETMTIKTFVMLVTELLQASDLKLTTSIKTKDGNTITAEYDFTLLNKVSDEFEEFMLMEELKEVEDGNDEQYKNTKRSNRASVKKSKTRES